MGKTLLAKNDPGFMELFDPELNKHVDLETLSPWNRNTTIYYKGPNGVVYGAICHTIFTNIRKNNGHYHNSRFDNYKYVMDNHIFRDWYLKYGEPYNPTLDIKWITQNESSIHINFEYPDGFKGYSTARRIFRSLKRTGEIKREKIKITQNSSQRLSDNAAFKEWFRQDLNPNINIEDLKFHNKNAPSIVYEREDGTLDSISVPSLMINFHNNGRFVEPQRPPKAVSVKGFTDFFNQRLNPDININELTRNSRVKIAFYNDCNAIVYRTVRTICDHLDANSIDALVSSKHPRPICKSKGENFSGSAMLQPGFQELFSKDLNPEIDISTLSASDKTPIAIYNPSGEIVYRSVVSICRNLKQNNGKYVYKNKIISGQNDAGTMDPELTLFWSKENKQPLDQVSPFSGHLYIFDCPFCGHKFQKAMKNIACKSPKCPNCNDGEKQIHDFLGPMGVAFLHKAGDSESYDTIP